MHFELTVPHLHLMTTLVSLLIVCTKFIEFTDDAIITKKIVCLHVIIPYFNEILEFDWSVRGK